MINSDDVTKKPIKRHNPIQQQILDNRYRILIIGGSGSGKINSLLNLISEKPDIDKIYLYAKDPFKTKFQFLINKRESTGLKDFNGSKAFIEYSNNMDCIYQNIKGDNPNKKCKILTAFHDMFSDMLSNKKINLIVTELLIRGMKINIYFVVITQSYFVLKILPYFHYENTKQKTTSTNCI